MKEVFATRVMALTIGATVDRFRTVLDPKTLVVSRFFNPAESSVGLTAPFEDDQPLRSLTRCRPRFLCVTASLYLDNYADKRLSENGI